MNDKNNKFLKTAVAVFVSLAIAGLAFYAGYVTREMKMPKSLKDAEFVLETIDKYYDGDFDSNEFLKKAVTGALDRYSFFYTPSDYQNVTIEREGINTGKLGLMFYSGSTHVYSVSGNSPADRAGIEEDGYVVAAKLNAASEFTPINNYVDFDTFTSGIDKGIKIDLKIRYGEEERVYTLAKEDFNESYVWYADSQKSYGCIYDKSTGTWSLAEREKPLKSNVIDGYAYIKFSRFNGDAAKQLKLALDKMKERGNKKLVLDLRNNGGGYMDILEKIAAMLCPGSGNRPIAVAKFKSGEIYNFYMKGGSYDNYSFEKICILANSNSASASEALIGAMLDYDASENKNVVQVYVSLAADGKYRTYGKGIMQSTFKNDNGGALTLTTAHLYWPKSNVTIHGVGVTPETDARVHGVAPAAGVDAELIAAMS